MAAQQLYNFSVEQTQIFKNFKTSQTTLLNNNDIERNRSGKMASIAANGEQLRQMQEISMISVKSKNMEVEVL